MFEIVKVNFSPLWSELMLIEAKVMTRFDVTLHVNEELMLDGEFKADNVGVQAPLVIDN